MVARFVVLFYKSYFRAIFDKLFVYFGILSWFQLLFLELSVIIVLRAIISFSGNKYFGQMELFVPW